MFRWRYKSKRAKSLLIIPKSAKFKKHYQNAQPIFRQRDPFSQHRQKIPQILE